MFNINNVMINDVVNNAESFNQDYEASVETNFRDKPNFEIG